MLVLHGLAPYLQHKDFFERTKSAREMVSGFSTASMGWPAAIRPTSGSTTAVFTLIACFSRPLGGSRSIERLRL